VANFVKLAAAAQRLINDNGRTVTIAKLGSYSQDTDQPWRGQGSYDIATVTGKAVFVSERDLGYTVTDEDNVRRPDKVALFAAADAEGHELETFDEIRDGGVVWRIMKAGVLAPADTRLLYMFEVTR
jgi:hypothetical protein